VADFTFERSLLDKGYRFIAGIDEVGRGALCGPVLAAAVILPTGWIAGPMPAWAAEIRDSKVLTPNKRRRLADLIRSEAVAVGLGSCTNEEIDRVNIFWASMEAMRRAAAALAPPPDAVLVDGFALRDFHLPQLGIPQGDKKSVLIGAASIVAKVVRDEMMTEFERLIPGYGLGRNKGYGTREHYRALDALGPTAFHRKSFKLREEGALF
jgi:ribonuclease HII